MKSQPKNLHERVSKAAEAALAAQNQVSPVDVFVGIGWLPSSVLKSWRQRRIDCLESAIQVNPARIAEAMRLLQSWAEAKGLAPSEVRYAAQQPGRQPLRFSISGNPTTERLYRTHWVSGALSEKQRKRLDASRAPELVVIQPLKDEWKCHRCGGTGDLLIMATPGPACLRCAGLDDLEFLPAGNALLTRRVKAATTRHAVVVRFSRSRRRYERQGLLVEPQALAKVRRELE